MKRTICLVSGDHHHHRFGSEESKLYIFFIAFSPVKTRRYEYQIEEKREILILFLLFIFEIKY